MTLDKKALIIDLDRHATEVLRLKLEEAGWSVKAAYDPVTVARHDIKTSFSLLFCDPAFPKIDDLSPVEFLNLMAPKIKIVPLVLEDSQYDGKLKEKFGIEDVLIKPYQDEDIESLLKIYATTGDEIKPDFGQMVGASASMRKLYNTISSISSSGVACLISGETGTGKELIARSIHDNSRRRYRRFVTLDCASLSEDLMEAELFGHVKGAFTGADKPREGKFEYADGGTLFIDELGEVTPRAQRRLLKVIETGRVQRLGANREIKVDVRLIFATNRNLLKMVEDGLFRPDLYHRVNVYPIKAPALRDRIEDISKLSIYFCNIAARKYGKSLAGISDEAINGLMRRSWSGNVRELQKVIDMAVLNCDNEMIKVGDIVEGPDKEKILISDNDQFGGLTYKEMLAKVLPEYERLYFEKLLIDSKGNMAKAARAAGFDRKTIYTKLSGLGIDPADFRDNSKGEK